MDLRKARQIGGRESHQEADRALGQPERQGARQNREQQGLQEKVECQAAPAGAQGGPHGHLAALRLRLRQEEIGGVGAGDQQDETDSAEENPEHADLIAEHVVAQGHGLRGKAGLVEKGREVDARQSLEELRGEPRQLGLGRRQVDPRLEAAEGAEAMAGLGRVRGVEPQRGPDVDPDLLELDLLREPRRDGEDARHLHGMPVDQDRAAHHGGVPPEAPPPEPFAEPGDGGLFRQAVFPHRRPAEERTDPEHGRYPGAHRGGVDLLGRLSTRRLSDGGPVDEIEPQGLKGALAVLKEEELRLGESHGRAARSRHRRLQSHQPVGARIGEGFQGDRVEHRENRGGGTDPQSQRQHGGNQNPGCRASRRHAGLTSQTRAPHPIARDIRPPPACDALSRPAEELVQERCPIPRQRSDWPRYRDERG